MAAEDGGSVELVFWACTERVVSPIGAEESVSTARGGCSSVTGLKGEGDSAVFSGARGWIVAVGGDREAESVVGGCEIDGSSTVDGERGEASVV